MKSTLKSFGLASLIWVLTATRFAAADIIYYLTDTVGTGTVLGTITTDGSMGALTTSDIVAWNVTITNGSSSANLTNSPGFNMGVVGTALTADAAGMYFNFGAAGLNYFVLDKSPIGQGVLCLIVGNPPGCGFAPDSTYSLQPDFPSAGNVTWEVGIGNVQIASTSAVPVPPALALFASGLAVIGLAARRRKKQRA